MRIASLFFFLFFAQTLYANDRDVVYDQVCRSLNFESSKKDCVNRIERYEYFDLSAATLCGKLSFDNDKLACIDAIGNREYARYEIDECSRTEIFNSGVVSCLRIRGQEAYRPAPVPVLTAPVSIPVVVPVYYPRYYYPHYWPHRPFYYPGLNIHIKL